MRKDNRRTIRTSIIGTERILSELATLNKSSFSSTECEHSCEYIGAMASELSKIALGARKKFLGYLLDLVAEEARTNAVHRRRASPAWTD